MDETGDAIAAPEFLDTDDRVEEVMGLLADDEPEEGDDPPPAASDKAEGKEAKAEPKEGDEQSTTPRTHKVIANGQEIEVDYEELKKGYSRHADYTKKSMELAEQRRTIEAEVNAEKSRFAKAADQALALAEIDPILSEGRRIDWSALAQQDPATYVRAKAEYDARLQHYRNIAEERGRVVAQQSSQQLAWEAQQLAEKVPEWGKPETQAELRNAAVKILESGGFNAQEINGATDHRMVALLVRLHRAETALAADKLAKASLKEKRVTQPTSGRTLKPSSNNADGSPSKRVETLKNRAMRNGNPEDTVNAIMAVLGD